MNGYPASPEIVGEVSQINNSGDESTYGSMVIGIQVRTEKGRQRDGVVDIDVQDFPKGNLVIRIPLPDLIAAISLATLNAEKE